jgi:DNA-binding SARP family transcriptional activator
VSRNCVYTLQLLGEFTLRSPEGAPYDHLSRKAKALIAMLATAEDGKRGRAWLRDRLWGSRGRAQGQNSLRQEIHRLRRMLTICDTTLIHSTSNHVAIDLNRIIVDVRDHDSAVGTTARFLDGLELPHEDLFREWLAQRRSRMSSQTRSDGEYPLQIAQELRLDATSVQLTGATVERYRADPNVCLRFSWSRPATLAHSS